MDFFELTVDDMFIKRERSLRRRLSRYGVTLEYMRRMYADQGGVCGICKSCTDDMCIDHDHTTQMVRGLLCNRCNLMIGMAKDDWSVLENAIEYLTRSALAYEGIRIG